MKTAGRRSCKEGFHRWPQDVVAHIMGTASTPLPEGCRRILEGLSVPYGLAIRLRAALYRQRFLATRGLPCRVISVGNLAVGGTGKTPLTIYLARLLRHMDRRVVILSRGYHGRAQRKGGVVSDGDSVLMDALTAGDEPLMMARQLAGVPVVVGGNRHTSGMLAIKRFCPDIILLDDAYQHQQLRRDVNLLLLDAIRPFGNGKLLPAGPLREPLSALERADAVVATRCHQTVGNDSLGTLKHFGPQPVFKSEHKPYLSGMIHRGRKLSWDNIEGGQTRQGFGFLAPTRVWGFSGLARNTAFLSTLKSFCAQILGFTSFADHHVYTLAELEDLGRKALSAGAQFIITTEKDAVRLPVNVRLPLDLVICGIAMVFQPEPDFDAFIGDCLQRWDREREEVPLKP